DAGRSHTNGKVSSNIRPIERHSEEEAQRRNRPVHGRWPHAGPPLMQLETAKILSRRRIGRAAEKGCESLDLTDIVVAGLLAEIAHAHVFDHWQAQWTDGLLAHRGAPVLRWRLFTPLDPQDGTPVCQRIRLTCSHAFTATCSVFARSALPRKRVRSLTQSGSGAVQFAVM